MKWFEGRKTRRGGRDGGKRGKKRRVADLPPLSFRKAFLSGCVVATDIPTDQEVELKQFVIEVSSFPSLLVCLSVPSPRAHSPFSSPASIVQPFSSNQPGPSNESTPPSTSPSKIPKNSNGKPCSPSPTLERTSRTEPKSRGC